MNKYLEAGKLINTHGVRGEFKFDAWCDSPTQFLKIKKFFLSDDGTNCFNVASIRKFGKFMLLKFEGIDTLDDALKYKGKVIYVDRDDVPKKEGAVFIADIIGLPAIDVDSDEVFGKIIDFTDKGSGNLYEVECLNGNTCYIPAIDVFTKKIDTNKGVFFKLIEGLID